MITTRNRRDDLRQTLTALGQLTSKPDEILICADGCSDGTVELVRERFAHCRLIENDVPRGSVFSRDRLLRAATGDIVISLDDDSYPVDRDFLERVKQLFNANPDVAVFSFPEVRDERTVFSPVQRRAVSAYANCAAAMRRDVYLRSSGFPLFFEHMYEEPDYALQCYSLGFVVQFEPSLPVRHHVSPVQRNLLRRHHQNARNELWSVLLRCPFPQVVGVAGFRLWRQFRHACLKGVWWIVKEPLWWWSALLGLPICFRSRKAIPWSIYSRWMRMPREPAQAPLASGELAAVTCAVVITSFNRRAELEYTCAQLQHLSPPPDEVIICLDESTDESRVTLAQRFPEFTVFENPTRQGSIPSRDTAFRRVKSDLILTLDDDSYPIASDFIARAKAVVRSHPEAGAFTFPEIRNGGRPANAMLGTDSPAHYVRDFPNCAGIIRRSLYGTVAKYPRFFSHAYGEPDLCLQLYTAGYAVWFEPSLPIRHHFTANQRNMLRRHQLNARNELWSVFLRCPSPYLFAIAVLRIVRQFVFAFSRGWRWWIREPSWWLDAIRGLPRCLAQRKPVDWKTYYQWLRLGRNSVIGYGALLGKFPRIGRPVLPQFQRENSA